MVAPAVVIAATSAAMGAVQLEHNLNTGGGFNLTAQGASYPRELIDFLPSDQYVDREVIKFFGNGYVWNTELAVAMHGYFSQSNEELLAYEDHPNLAGNRYLKDVEFYRGVSSDSVSSSLLEINLVPEQQAGGSPDYPYLIWHVDGHFDPVGFGDVRFSFHMWVDTYGQVSYDNDSASGGLEISLQGDHVYCYLNQ
jgi:hypothetical protein